MDVDTLLTRQMELHTSVRHPPKNAEQLTGLHETMRNYHRFFRSLKALGDKLGSDPETVFQCFMYISMGGAVSFDKQHQDGSVPMHQAKVLARASAIELEPAVRDAVPLKELMVYVGLSKDLRTTLRVKVEDGNDLLTAEKSVREALEYLDFIHARSAGDANRMFAFYMVEEAATLERMLQEAAGLSGTGSAGHNGSRGAAPKGSPLAASLSIGGGTVSDAAWSLSGTLSSPTQPGGEGCPSLIPLPSPLSSLPAALKQQAEVAENAKANASQRVKAAQAILDWATTAPTEYFSGHIDPILQAVSSAVSVLVAEKRSTLCRLGCNIIALLMQRITDEPYLTERGDSSVLASCFVSWTQVLCKGVFVTVAAISTATDAALRELVLGSHGHTAVVKAVLSALQNGTQTELRRRCLGYLALAVVAASCSSSKGVAPSFSALLVEPVQKYVQTGDSPSRKMARALCAVLRAVSHLAVPISDPKTEKLIQMEKAQILPYLDSPRELERVLFETSSFISSMRPGTGSLSSSRPASSSVRDTEWRSTGAGVPTGPTAVTAAATDVGPVGQRHARATSRTVLSHATAAASENPMDSYPPKRGRHAKVLAPAAAAPTPISAVPLTEAPLLEKKAPPRRPAQLPPISPVGAVAGVFETSASLSPGEAGSMEEEESSALDLGKETEEPGAALISARARKASTSPLAYPLQPPSPLRELLTGAHGGHSSSDRLLPLSLWPGGSNSPSAHGLRRGGAPHQPGAVNGIGVDGGVVGSGCGPILSPVRGPKSGSADSHHTSTSVSTAEKSPSRSGTAQSRKGTVPRLSEALRRKIDGHPQ